MLDSDTSGVITGLLLPTDARPGLGWEIRLSGPAITPCREGERVVRQPNQMIVRRCVRCDEWLPLEEFPWKVKAKNRRQSYCFTCRTAYHKEWYAKNREARKAQIEAYKAWVQAHGDDTRAPMKCTKAQLAREFRARGLPVPDIEHLTKVELIELLFHDHVDQ